MYYLSAFFASPEDYPDYNAIDTLSPSRAAKASSFQNAPDPTEQVDHEMTATTRVSLNLIPTEILEQIVEPVIISRGDCRGHRRADSRGILLENYEEEVRKLIHLFGFRKEMASVALRMFKSTHTLRLEAKKLRYIPERLQSLTVFFHGGNLSSCDIAAFKSLRASIPMITQCFPSIQALKLEVTWDINEDQERFGPLFIDDVARGGIWASVLPLIDIRGAHKTCKEYLFLIWELHELCLHEAHEIEVLSMGRSAVFRGNWEQDIEAATYLFTNSNAWNERGFQVWMSEYSAVHYALGDVEREGEPIAVEILTCGADLYPGVSDQYDTWLHPEAADWAECYPAMVASQRKAITREKEEREAMG